MPYTPIVLPADLKTHMYAEVQDEISRSDSDIVSKAIDAAIDEAKMYLSRFDRIALFGDVTTDVAAIFSSPSLVNMIKSMAVWHVTRLCNVSIDLTIIRDGYKDAIRQLKDIQKGDAEPENWPLWDAAEDADPIGDNLQFNFSTKRNNTW